MIHVFVKKLCPPPVDGLLARPRLLPDSPGTRVLLVHAPAGAGKSVFLAQWLSERERPSVFYELDEADSDPRVFAAHLSAGFQQIWPDWTPRAADPAELAAEVASEAGRRPPMDLVLDQVEAGLPHPHVSDFLGVLLRFLPPVMTIALGTRSVLPVDWSMVRSGLRTVTVNELAFTEEEAEAALGDAPWAECFRLSGGLPLAMELWRQCPECWQTALAERVCLRLPHYVSPAHGRELVRQWLAGEISLREFAQQTSHLKPGLGCLRADVQVIHTALCAGDFTTAAVELDHLCSTARRCSDRALMGAAALLQAEVHYGRGEYVNAWASYRQAFELDPQLELTGTHSYALLMRDLGYLSDAESFTQRRLAACEASGDLTAQVWARVQHGVVCLGIGRHDDAEREFAEASVAEFRLSSAPMQSLRAMIGRAEVESLRGSLTVARTLCEEARALAAGISPRIEAHAASVMACVLYRWGERDAARRLVLQSIEMLERMGAKHHLHVVLAELARALWAEGSLDSARQYFDRSLQLSAAGRFLGFLSLPRNAFAPLLADALVRGHEAAQCQKLLVRIGEAALPALRSLAEAPAAGARQAALYPLAAVGGPEAERILRSLAADPDEQVRDGAKVALQSPPDAARSAGVSAAPEEDSSGSAPGLPPVAVTLLGTFTVQVAGRRIQSWRTAKARDLLAFLVVSRGRPVTRDQMVEALWPGLGPYGAQALHTALYHLRRALGPASGMITFCDGLYQLDYDALTVDLDCFQRHAASEAEEDWRLAVARYQGDLLEGLDYTWCNAPRLRARLIYLDTLRHQADSMVRSARYGEAIETLHLLVQTEPLAEDAHVNLMECYAAMGNRSAAVQQYLILVRTLNDELGLAPSEDAQGVYQRLIQ